MTKSSTLSQRLKEVLGIKGTPAIASPLSELNKLRSANDRGLVCHAPFKSLRFEQNGAARTCCFNSMAELGRYPKQSLEEIWNSENANRLRESIRHNDFSFGCQLCAAQLDNGEYSTIKSRGFDGLPTTQNNYPVVLDFSLHNTCNLECVMCNGEFSSSIRKNREKLPALPLAYDDEFLIQLRPFVERAKQFIFAGGEPFLIELYHKIWDLINDLSPNSDVHVVTNGTILNQRIKRILEKGRFHITQSLESVTQSNYERIRKNASFEVSMQNMDFFQKYCASKGTQFALNVCPVQENWSEIPSIVEFCNEKKIKLYLLTVVYPPTSTLMSLSSSKLIEVIEYLSRQQFDVNSELVNENIAQYNDLILKLEGWKVKAVIEESTGVPESRIGSDKTSTTNRVEFSKLTTVFETKLEEYMTTNAADSGLNAEDVKHKISFLKDVYENRYLTELKIYQAEGISPSMVASIFKTYSKSDLQQLVRDHFL